jgi:serine/threonine protein kinase
MTSLALPVPARQDEAQAAAVGLLLGRYQLRERRGRGSLAEVYRAVDLAGGRDVAVKIAADSTAKQQERIHNEARILAGLDHPAIIGFVAEGLVPDGCLQAGRPFIVEELAFGMSLAERLRVPDHNRTDVAAWAVDLFDGISHLHARGLVHRDIKPANLMLSGLRRSLVRIVDFGIAARAGTLSEPGISSGTAHYMSPEQASGEAARPSWDVYALGLVLLELLTGTKAFPGTPLESLVARTLRSPEIPHSVGRGWHELLTAATAMDPADRPTAAEASALASSLIPGRRPRRANLVSLCAARQVPFGKPASAD